MKLLRRILEMFSTIALGLEGLVLLVLNFAAPDKFADVFTSMSGAMLVEIVIFFISLSLGNSKFQEDLPQDINKSFDNLNKDIISRVDEINKDIKTFNNASIEVLTTQNDFYDKLKKSRSSALHTVDLTQLDPWAPKEYEDVDSSDLSDEVKAQHSSRVNYFTSDIEFAQSHPNVQIRRIISIPSDNKLEWVKDFIEATKSISNLFLAYVSIPDIEKDTPFPKMLSLQIIDSNEVFMLNPKYSYMPRQYEHCFYIKNADVGKIYTDYYNSIWEKLKNSDDVNIGMILKNGTDIKGYEDKLNQIRNKLNRVDITR